MTHPRRLFKDYTEYENALDVRQKLELAGLWNEFETYHERHAKYLQIPSEAAADIFAINAFMVKKVLGFSETFAHRNFVYMQLQKLVVPTNDGVPFLLKDRKPSQKIVQSLVAEASHAACCVPVPPTPTPPPPTNIFSFEANKKQQT